VGSSTDERQRWICGLSEAADLRAFLAEDDNPDVLAERIFESNVRGFVLDSGVNEDIAKSLLNPDDEPNFGC
jgi:hypothetical protein